MRTINIKQSLKLSDIDNLYKDLNIGINSKEKINLQLPKKLTKNFFSVVPSLIQFVASWVRFAQCGKLILDLDENKTDEIKSLYDQEFVFPILALVWNDIAIENEKGINLRPHLRNYQNDFVLNMREIKGMKGEKLLFVNLDHFGPSLGILPFFETNGNFNPNETDLKNKLETVIFDRILKYNRGSKIDVEELYGDIVGIIHELMKNTFEWAIDDENRKPFSPNIRGLYIRFHKKGKPKILEDYSDVKSISSYFKSSKIDKNNLDEVYFLEISVIDSGAGFIKKFKSQNTDDLTDIEIIQKCLTKNQTSSTGVYRNEKGLGLDRILNILNDKNGFVRIKTDKYCLYRDLIQSPYKESNNSKDMDLYDWKTNSNKDYTQDWDCSGSNVSILYPLPQTFRAYE